jgi:Amt family ammonium transporter
MPPHNMTMCVIGTGMLWVGWFGFNGGSALAANGNAAMAITVTQISAATAGLTWMSVEWVKNGSPSMLGLATGAIAGLAAVTPASGFVGPIGGFSIGLASGALCYLAIGKQVGVQLLAAVITIVYTAAATFVILKLVDLSVGLRIDEEGESRGLDLSLHNEVGYNF